MGNIRRPGCPAVTPPASVTSSVGRSSVWPRGGGSRSGPPDGRPGPRRV